MILFVGDKPSKRNIDPNVAFVGTKSHDTLKKWFEQMNICCSVKLINQVDRLFEVEVKWAFSHHYPVVALGKEAEKAILNIANKMRKSDISDIFYALPHPSGRNLKLNDQKYVDKILKECHDFLCKFGYNCVRSRK